MATVRTFSTAFPKGHLRAGEPTYFVEKIWECIGLPSVEYTKHLPDQYINFLRRDSETIWPKGHTIRGSKFFKKGNYFSPRIWSGVPYNSKQIAIAPDVLIHNAWDFKIDKWGSIYINKKHYAYYGDICKNDGLSPIDFRSWFKMPDDDAWMKPFAGQIICWDENISYE